MGQKVNPKGFRLAVRRDWESRWFASKGDYAEAVNEDYRIREFLNKKLKAASVPRIFIERAGQRIRVKIYTEGIRSRYAQSRFGKIPRQRRAR